MSIERSMNIATGLVFRKYDLRVLMPLLDDEAKEMLSPAYLAVDYENILVDLLGPLSTVLPAGLVMDISADQASGSFEGSLIIYARGTRMDLTFKEKVFSAFSIDRLPQPTPEELKAFEVFEREPQTIIWGSIS